MQACAKFISKSKAELKESFLLQKGLDFIKKYNISEYINTNKEFSIDKYEFIKWYNVRERDVTPLQEFDHDASYVDMVPKKYHVKLKFQRQLIIY